MEKNKLYVLILLYFAFIALGLPDQLLSVAWPTMRIDFQKPLDAAGLSIFLVTVFTSLSGYLNGYVAARFSVQKILVVSVLLTAIGLLGYAFSPSWFIFLLFSIPLGIGAGSVDSSLNNYVSVHYSSRHMNWLHAFWGVGSTLGPLIMTGVFAFNFGWRSGYFIVSAMLFMLSFIFALSGKFWENVSFKSEGQKSAETVKIVGLNTFLSALFFFLYTSTEGGIGLWMYSVMTEARGFEPTLAGILTAVYWGSLTFGRIIVGFITKKFTDKQIIFTGIVIALISMGMLCSTSKILTAAALITLGFGLSGIYPCLMNDTHKRYKQEIAQILTGHQVGAANLGYATVTPLLGIIIQRIGLNFLPVILIFFVLIILFIELRLRKLNLYNQ